MVLPTFRLVVPYGYIISLLIGGKDNKVFFYFCYEYSVSYVP